MSAGNDGSFGPHGGTRSSVATRGLRPGLIWAGVLFLGLAGLGGYWALRETTFVSLSAAPNVSQAPVFSRPTELTTETAAKLLADALAQRPIVARLALGDVATVDRNGASLPLYPALAQAQIVRLRFCRFPGTGASAAQICLADLTDNAKPYVHRGGSPSRRIAGATEDLQAANRSFVELVLAVPRVDRIGSIAEPRRGEKLIAYTAHFEPTPLANAFGLSGDASLQSISGTAVARSSPSGWMIQDDGLQQTEAKAN